VPTLRKLVFEYDNSGASSATTRTFLQSHLVELARENPHVEVVVRQRNQRQPIIRGFYGQWSYSLKFIGQNADESHYHSE
jgi:large subunit ribosomal protein L43